MLSAAAFCKPPLVCFREWSSAGHGSRWRGRWCHPLHPVTRRRPCSPDRTLWLHRVQTRKRGKILYFQDQTPDPGRLFLLCYLLRDVRAEQVTRMDVKLIHLLFGMQAWMRSCGIRQPLRITAAIGRWTRTRIPKGRRSIPGISAVRRWTSPWRGFRVRSWRSWPRNSTVAVWGVSDLRPCRYRAGAAVAGISQPAFTPTAVVSGVGAKPKALSPTPQTTETWKMAKVEI